MPFVHDAGWRWFQQLYWCKQQQHIGTLAAAAPPTFMAWCIVHAAGHNVWDVSPLVVASCQWVSIRASAGCFPGGPSAHCSPLKLTRVLASAADGACTDGPVLQALAWFSHGGGHSCWGPSPCLPLPPHLTPPPPPPHPSAPSCPVPPGVLPGAWDYYVAGPMQRREQRPLGKVRRSSSSSSSGPCGPL